MPDDQTSKIATDLPAEVLTALAEACGLRIAFDQAPDTNAWSLTAARCAGPVEYTVQYVGTRQDVCAFLAGYAAMQQQAQQILNELNSRHRDLLLSMKSRLGR